MTTASQITKMLKLLGEEFDFDATEALDFLKEEAPELLKKSEKKSESTPRKSRKGQMTGWLLFRRENKGNIKDQSVQWKALTDEERAEFGDRAKEMNSNRIVRTNSSASVSSSDEVSSPDVTPNKKSRKGVMTGWLLFRRENKGKMKEQSVQWKALTDDERAEFGDRAKQMNASR